MTYVILAHRPKYPSVTTFAFGPKAAPVRNNRGRAIEFDTKKAAERTIAHWYLHGTLPEGCTHFTVAKLEGVLPD